MTVSGRVCLSSLVNLAPSSTSAPSFAILLAMTGAFPPRMDLWLAMENAVSVISLNNVLLLTNLLQKHTASLHLLHERFKGCF